MNGAQSQTRKALIAQVAGAISHRGKKPFPGQPSLLSLDGGTPTRPTDGSGRRRTPGRSFGDRGRSRYEDRWPNMGRRNDRGRA